MCGTKTGNPDESFAIVEVGTRVKHTRVGLHVHPYAGTTCVLSGGTITVFVEGATDPLVAPPGTCYYMEAGALMTASNLSDEDAVLMDTFTAGWRRCEHHMRTKLLRCPSRFSNRHLYEEYERGKWMHWSASRDCLVTHATEPEDRGAMGGLGGWMAASNTPTPFDGQHAMFGPSLNISDVAHSL